MAGWLHAALRAVLPHVGDIIAAGKPAFTKREALPAANQDLVQQQIAELQGAVSQQSSHIKELAAQLENTVNALEKAAPREEITRLRFGGISVPRAVDVSPSRRLDMALRNICVGATSASFKSRKAIQDCLADEILKASRGEMESAAVAKRDELERIAMSAR